MLHSLRTEVENKTGRCQSNKAKKQVIELSHLQASKHHDQDTTYHTRQKFGLPDLNFQKPDLFIESSNYRSDKEN